MSNVCPSCGNPADHMIKIESGKKLALNLSYDEACSTCYESLPSKVSQGYKLRKEEEQRQQNKVKLWKSRVELLKQGRTFLSQKAYSEAALSYEKYLRVLEIIYDVPVGQMSPEIFSKSARSTELTVITSVYWDLLKTYDSHKKYEDRMILASQKLAEFAPYSPIFSNIAKKAESFARTAKNPAPIKSFLKIANARRSGCFIATAVYGSSLEPEVALLKQFRDQVLIKYFAGRLFVRAYYVLSPPLAHIIYNYPVLKTLVKWPVSAIVGTLKKFNTQKNGDL